VPDGALAIPVHHTHCMLPREVAARFVSVGGTVRVDHDGVVFVEDPRVVATFEDGLTWTPRNA
jgi:hypothetical protein